MDAPAGLPSVALESELLLYAERGFALLAILLFALVVVARGWRGELPIALSQRGAEWAVAAGESDRVLQAQVAELRARLTQLEKGLETVSEIVTVQARE